MFSLKGKQAVVTGGGSGIGRAIAFLLARHGASVAVMDIRDDQAMESVMAIIAEGYRSTALVADVTDQQQVVNLLRALPQVDILVNSAGISHIGTAGSTSEADFDRLFQVNVKGVYNCLHAVVPMMKDQRGGVIVNICSIAARLGLEERFAYSMTKGAVYSMTLSVARDYIGDNIRCNSVSPARVHTPFVDGFLKKNFAGKEEEMFDKLSKTQPIGRMAKPEEVAALVLYLCSDEAAFITGCDYPIDGGFINLNG